MSGINAAMHPVPERPFNAVMDEHALVATRMYHTNSAASDMALLLPSVLNRRKGRQ